MASNDVISLEDDETKNAAEKIHSTISIGQEANPDAPIEENIPDSAAGTGISPAYNVHENDEGKENDEEKPEQLQMRAFRMTKYGKRKLEELVLFYNKNDADNAIFAAASVEEEGKNRVEPTWQTTLKDLTSFKTFQRHRGLLNSGEWEGGLDIKVGDNDHPVRYYFSCWAQMKQYSNIISLIEEFVKSKDYFSLLKDMPGVEKEFDEVQKEIDQQDELTQSNEEKLFECNVCGRIFVYADLYKAHMTKHRPEPPVIVTRKPLPCREEGCTFYGSPENEGYCSVCYDHVQNGGGYM